MTARPISMRWISDVPSKMVKLVERADEFEDSARTSLAKDHLGPAIERL